MVYWLALAAALVPTLVWLFALYRADRFEPEPPRLIAKLFGLGVVSAFVAIFASVAAGRVLPDLDDLSGRSAIPALVVVVLVYALLEEASKLGLAFAATRRDPEFDEPLDGIIYAGTVALGFAATETFLYIASSLEETGARTILADSWVLESGVVEGFFVTAPLRALLSAVGHLTYTGIGGYFLARYRLGAAPLRVAVGGLLVATLLHAAYNLPLFLLGALGDTAELGPLAGLLLLVAWPAAWLLALEIFLVLVGRAVAASPHRARALATADARVADARAEFHRRRVRLLVGLPLLYVLVAWVPLALAGLGLPAEVAVIFAVVLVLGMIGLVRITWRCPSCGAHLGIRYPRSCRRCGIALRSSTTPSEPR